MLTDVNRKISIIAYYISKFDKDAINALGYDTYTSAFAGVSMRFGKTNNYMKLRRDEFDAIVSNIRQGWNKRNPAPNVLLMHNNLKNFTFEELTNIVKGLIDDNDNEPEKLIINPSEQEIITSYSEEEYENIINAKDISASIKKKISSVNIRIYDRSIPNNLKILYNCRCQICGYSAMEMYGVDISEAHHIDPFTKSINNNSKNIIILCPDHHRIIHKTQAIFNFKTQTFEYSSLKTEKLLLNFHL